MLLKHSVRLDIPIIGLLAAILFFATNGMRPLDNPDEGRYTEIPREMLENGDWVSPRLNGVLYFEKPPLYYWLQTVALTIGGVNETSSRFWSAAFALLGCITTYLGGRSIFGREAGFYGALILASSFLYFALSQVVILDMAVSVLISAALIVFLLCLRAPPGRKRFVLSLTFFALLAVGTLTKGLIGLIIPCAIIFIWALLLNKWKTLWPFYPIAGFALFFAIAVPWHVLAWRAHPEFAWFYFVNEHFLRYLTPSHERVQPFWYFFALLPVGLFPWVGFLFQAFMHPLKGGWPLIKTRSEHVFLIIWVLFILLFFSTSSSKLIPYLLPVYPALALLIGEYLSKDRSNRAATIKFSIYVFVCIALVFAVAFPWAIIDRGAKVASNAFVLSCGISLTLLLGSVVTLVWARKRSGVTLLAPPFMTMFIFYLLVNPLAGTVRNNSTKLIAQHLRELEVPASQIFSLLEYIQDLPPYLGSTVSVAACEPQEQRFGYSLEKNAANWLTAEEFLNSWESDTPQFAVADKGEAETFSFEHPTWRAYLIMESTRYVLLTNQSSTNLQPQAEFPLLVSKKQNNSISQELDLTR